MFYDKTYPTLIQISKTTLLSSMRIEHRTKQLWKFKTTLDDSLQTLNLIENLYFKESKVCRFLKRLHITASCNFNYFINLVSSKRRKIVFHPY